ncbi:MAG: helix-turn-helix transcriptional regulator [Erysipelotrichales bacterium]
MYKYEYFHFKRKNCGVTLSMLAEEIGVSKSYISHIEKGNRRLSYDLAYKLANYFNMSPDELFLEDHQIANQAKSL